MKTTFLIMLIITVQIFSQGWNNTVTTTVNEPNLVKMDLFTNKDGNHIIVQNSNSTNSIKYYLFNSSGSVVRSSTIETSGYAEFPNVSGDNDKVYLVYKLGSNLKVRRSTNAGQSWLSDINNLSIGSNTCNGVDIVYADNGVHVVYAMKDSDPVYETYYYKINSSGSWVDYKNVTDYNANEMGGFPTVTTSGDRVHISYNTGFQQDPVYNWGEAKTRDRYAGTWQTPQLVFGGLEGGTGTEKLYSDNNFVFDFYYKCIWDMSPFYNNLYVKMRTVGGNSWFSETLIEGNANPRNLVSPSKTYDGKTNIFYQAGYPATIYHKSYNGTNWSSGYSVATISTGYLNAHSTSVVSNDLFISFKESSSNYLKYRQYDAVSLAPQNLAVTAETQSGQSHPKLTWALNNEPDVYGNTGIAYRIERRFDYNGVGNWTAWTQIATKNGTTSTFIDEGVNGAGSGPSYVQYRMKAQDISGYQSAYSSSAGISYGFIEKSSSVTNSVKEYNLGQNYPNPFNPTTKISWQSPVSSLQTIKVYDVLGNEVAVLVNEVKPEGYHEIEFDAANLPSGMYFYKLEAGKFTSVKKMLLVR